MIIIILTIKYIKMDFKRANNKCLHFPVVFTALQTS